MMGTAVAVPAAAGEPSEGLLARCWAGLRVLAELDAIDAFQWSTVEGKYPDRKKEADRLPAAFEKFGMMGDGVSAEESARRITNSPARDRLLGALDYWLVLAPSKRVRSILKEADPDKYREGIRDAILLGKMDVVAEQAGQAEALKQPGWFAGVLGQVPAVPVIRRRELLEIAVRSHPGNLTLY